MKGQRVGYIRVSSEDQNEARQLDTIQLDRTFTDKASGGSLNRPQLEEALKYVREGDWLIVHSIDRLARSLSHLLTIVDDLSRRGVVVQFVKEGLIFDGRETPMAALQLRIIGAVAEFERMIIRERQKEGITLAKKRGVYKGRRPVLSKEQVFELQERFKAGEKRTALMQEYDISRATLYLYLKRHTGLTQPTT